MSVCAANPTDGFATRLLDYVDCQAQTIGAGGYQALGAPGSTLSLMMGGLLIIFIALFGYRMLLGQTPGLRDGVGAIVKIGIVFTLAFSWPAYRTLIYDVALKGPAELASQIGRPAGLPGSDGGLVARLDGADQAFVALAALGTGAGGPIAATGAAQASRQGVSVFDPLALGLARLIYLVGAVGALAAMRLVAGIMLALGPFFIAFLLFEGTRGLFEGWIRVLAGAALGALGVAVVLGVELALIEPWLAQLLAWRTAGYSIAGAPTELLVVSLVFAISILAVLIAAWRLTVGFGLPAAWRAAPARLIAAVQHATRLVPTVRNRTDTVERSRAIAVANAVASTMRREFAGGAGHALAPRRAEPHDAGRAQMASPARTPLGQSYRRARTRLSASTARRDKSS